MPTPTLSRDVEIADALVAIVDAAGCVPEGATIERRLMPIYTVDALDQMRIAIAPRAHSREWSSRRSTRRDHIVQIAPHLRARVDDAGQIDEAQLVAFVGTVEAIADAIELYAQSNTIAGATLQTIQTDPLYDPDALQSPGVLRAVLTLSLRIIAEVPNP